MCLTRILYQIFVNFLTFYHIFPPRFASGCQKACQKAEDLRKLGNFKKPRKCLDLIMGTRGPPESQILTFFGKTLQKSAVKYSIEKHIEFS